MQFLIVLMQSEMFGSLIRWSSIFSFSRVTVMDISSSIFIMCRLGCDVMLICVMVFVLGLTTPAPRAGLPSICEPSMYTKSRGFHCSCGVWCAVCLLSCVGVLIKGCLFKTCCCICFECPLV